MSGAWFRLQGFKTEPFSDWFLILYRYKSAPVVRTSRTR